MKAWNSSVKTVIGPCPKPQFIMNGWRSITLPFEEPLVNSSIEIMFHLEQLEWIQLRQILDLKFKLQSNETSCSSIKTLKQAQFHSIWSRSVLLDRSNYFDLKRVSNEMLVLLCLSYLLRNHLGFWQIFSAFNWPRFFLFPNITHNHITKTN